jgi:hypothetical protein
MELSNDVLSLEETCDRLKGRRLDWRDGEVWFDLIREVNGLSVPVRRAILFDMICRHEALAGRQTWDRLFAKLLEEDRSVLLDALVRKGLRKGWLSAYQLSVACLTADRYDLPVPGEWVALARNLLEQKDYQRGLIGLEKERDLNPWDDKAREWLRYWPAYREFRRLFGLIITSGLSSLPKIKVRLGSESEGVEQELFHLLEDTVDHGQLSCDYKVLPNGLAGDLTGAYVHEGAGWSHFNVWRVEASQKWEISLSRP